MGDFVCLEDAYGILDIPEEVRAKMFSRLNQRAVLKLRLVCHQFKEDVDSLLDFTADLDDRRPSFERVCQLRLRSCRVLSLLKGPPLGPGTTLLRHPNLLRSLSIRTDQITPDNFHYLLADCSEFLQEFSSLLTTTLLTHPFPEGLTYKFNNLKSLSLSVNTLSTIGSAHPFAGPPTTIQDNLFHQLVQNPMPQLKSLRIELRLIGYAQISKFSSLIFSFILRHYSTLESLDFDLIQGHGMPSSDVRPISAAHISIIEPYLHLLNQSSSKLQAIRVVNSTSIGIDLWSEFLSKQANLSLLETDILPAPASLFKQIIQKNCATLVHCDIGDLTLDKDEDTDDDIPFDLSVFQSCTRLKKLTLDRNTSTSLFHQMRPRAAPIAEDRAHLTNLSCLPSSLQELALNYFLILSDELLFLFTSGAGRSLKSLTLAQCGSTGNFGVNGSALEMIVSLENIQFVEISPLNFDYGEEEKRKLNLILTTFGYHEGHSYIQLSRDGLSAVEDFLIQDNFDEEDDDEF